MKRYLAAGAILMFAAAPAWSADVITTMPVAAFDWSGAYLGAEIGYGWGRDSIRDQNRTSGISDYSDHFNLNGALGGIYAGYNFQQGNFVYGIDGDIEASGVDGDNPNWPFGDNSTARIRWQGALRGRLGYAFSNNLLYASGGLALGDIKTEYFDGPAKDSDSTVKSGWTIGAGFEHAFTPNWVARIDYRYTDFGRVTDSTVTTDPGWNEHNDLTQHTIQVCIAYKFN
jgi:outer membrane immunogenic protein